MRLVVRLALTAITVVTAAVVAHESAVVAQTVAPAKTDNMARPAGANEVRALVVPRREAKLSSRITARILTIGPEPGLAFKKGNTLVTFDCRAHRAQRRKAQATLLAATKTFENRTQLRKLQSGSVLALELARAEQLKARASLEEVLAVLHECMIRAPFAGRVVARMANAHESVTPGTPLIEIIDERDLDARVIVPSRWLSWIKVGKKLDIRIEELNQSYKAEVRTIGSRVDPVSQSIEITAGLLGDLTSLKPGMSGVAVFPGN